MPAFKPLLLLAAALLLAASSGAAAEKARLLEDTWSQASYGAPHSSPHQPAEVLTTCLRETAFTNCRVLNDYTYHFESKVTCCSDAAANKDAFAEGDIDIGSCAIEATSWLDDPIVVSATAQKVGAFIATCTLKNAASLCGTPFCEQMVLTAQGAVYLTEGVVSYTRPDIPLVDASCRPSRAGSRLLPGEALSKSDKAPAGKNVAAASAEVAEGGHEATTEYYSGNNNVPRTVYKGVSLIFSGPLTLDSRYYDVKWQGAHMEFVYNFRGAEPIPEDEARDAYVVEPFTFKLSFTKPRGAPY